MNVIKKSDLIPHFITLVIFPHNNWSITKLPMLFISCLFFSCLRKGRRSFVKKITFAFTLEQGAKAAFILKTFPDAYQARELESKIACGSFGILEGVTQKQKADILCTDRYNPDTALTVLKEYLKKIELLPESDFINLYSDYFYGKDVSFTYPDKTKLFSDSLIGEAVGMVGDMVVIKQQDRFFPITKFVFISIKNFISYQVK